MKTSWASKNLCFCSGISSPRSVMKRPPPHGFLHIAMLFLTPTKRHFLAQTNESPPRLCNPQHYDTSKCKNFHLPLIWATTSRSFVVIALWKSYHGTFLSSSLNARWACGTIRLRCCVQSASRSITTSTSPCLCTSTRLIDLASATSTAA
jgi:hypothetical protein